jgi:hypothetical protein
MNMSTEMMVKIPATTSTHEPVKNEMARGTTAVPMTAANHAGLKYSTTSENEGLCVSVVVM